MKITYAIVLLSSMLLVSCEYKSNPILNLDGALVSAFQGIAGGSSGEVTWDNDIAPIFRNDCAGCHNFTDYEQVKNQFSNILLRVQSKSKPMPPQGLKALSKIQISLLQKWRRGGFAQSESAPSVNAPTSGAEAPIATSEFNAKSIINNQCVGCHESGMAGVPNLYSLTPHYLEAELSLYKKHKRFDSAMFTMQGAVENFSNEEITKIAQELTTRKECSANIRVDALSGDVANGKTLFNSCQGCHKPQVSFNPKIHGQDTQYLINTMVDFIKDESPRPATVMRMLLSSLSSQDIADIAAYLNSIQTCKK